MKPDVSYLTAEGLEKTRKELESLKGPVREALAKRLRAAIEMGDLSENADYSAAKEEQAFVEGRIQELEMLLRNVVVIDEVEKDPNQVNIGDYITVLDLEYDEEETYFLVGPKEADPLDNRISYESPIGRSLIGHKVGDTVTAETPHGTIRLRVLKIE